MSSPSVARLSPFREVRNFAPPPRGGFALSLVAAEHNSMHSGVCLHTRRLKWCKLLYNTRLSLRAEGRSFVAPAAVRQPGYLLPTR